MSAPDYDTKAELYAYKLGHSHFGAEVYVVIETMARELEGDPAAVATLRELFERLKPVYRGEL